jgi:uncharacterized protein YhaN
MCAGAQGNMVLRDYEYFFKALADFSTTERVIMFTHHNHLCDVARRNGNEDE